MKTIRYTILPVLLATVWISISEFGRNMFIVRGCWVSHYRSLGLTFPESPLNGALWGLWSLFFAITVFIISGRFNLVQTTLLSWFSGFVLMWVVIGNMGILPCGILPYAIPLSLLEAFIAALIIKRLSATRND